MQRIFVREPLQPEARITLNTTQTNYLVNVLRLEVGNIVIIFNGTDGEWHGKICTITKKACHITADQQIALQTHPKAIIHYIFAPLRQARLDYMIQKATEMGATNLIPVITAHTQVRTINAHRMHANATEAAEQCGLMYVPNVSAPIAIRDLVGTWEQRFPGCPMIFCDETEIASNPIPTLTNIKKLSAPGLAILIGPEGGFSSDEREFLYSHLFVHPIALGPRILRADTAAVAALAVAHAIVGDW